MTLIQYAIARHKAQLERLQERRPLRSAEAERLKLLRAICADYESKEYGTAKINVQSGT